MTDLIVIIVLAIILGSASFYIYKAKKNGQRCIGCPNAGKCGKAEQGSCHCSEETK